TDLSHSVHSPRFISLSLTSAKIRPISKTAPTSTDCHFSISCLADRRFTFDISTSPFSSFILNSPTYTTVSQAPISGVIAKYFTAYLYHRNRNADFPTLYKIFLLSNILSRKNYDFPDFLRYI